LVSKEWTVRFSENPYPNQWLPFGNLENGNYAIDAKLWCDGRQYTWTYYTILSDSELKAAHAKLTIPPVFKDIISSVKCWYPKTKSFGVSADP